MLEFVLRHQEDLDLVMDLSRKLPQHVKKQCSIGTTRFLACY